MSKLAPVALFVYNRPDHSRVTLDALKNNILAKESELFVFSDAAKNASAVNAVEKVRGIVSDISGFRDVTVVRREVNYGLARSIIEGVSSIIGKYGKVIVLEDDLVTSPYFLNYMNDALTVFDERKDVVSVTGFNFSRTTMRSLDEYADDVFLNIRPMSWSWATWYDRWRNVDWLVSDYREFLTSRSNISSFNKGGTDLAAMLDAQMRGKLDSWYIRWCYHSYKHNGRTVYPKISFVNNTGHDNSGTHCVKSNNGVFGHKELNARQQLTMKKDLQIQQRIVDEFNQKFNLSARSKVKQFIRKIIGL